ncbi:helicase [Anabaena sp. FACHB-1391]|uniref:type ISP restriction/modification enzyme n=1 Tax=Anabaena sp. FACHB-1391 TaxID=2692771 RepID=UPI0016811ACF|nr:type ISP restriction/modification enzyme [Anabaena sp. FACHB-1391]MBD2269905.1 helicase [Anabaena sp. FACHB-1391]
MKKAKIYYARMDEFWTKEEKLKYLENLNWYDVDWQEIKPDKNNNWLTDGLENDFDNFIAIGSKEVKKQKDPNPQVIFKLFSLGVASNRDEWVFSFCDNDLQDKIKTFIQNYNIEVSRYFQQPSKPDIETFIDTDSSFIKWTDRLKLALERKEFLLFDNLKIRNCFYRPFIKQYIYFDHLLNQRRYQQHIIFPTPETEKENQVIWIKVGTEIPMFALSINYIPDLLPQGGSQCFPFYTYNEDGTNRQENITDWALKQYQNHYQDTTITKWDIFYYIYAVLHHPHYRERYAANLKRELPRIPFAPQFHPFVIAGKRLAEIHINYEKQPEYHLKHLENKDLPIDWRVEKMRLSKDKTQIKYNDFLTLTGIPSAVFLYRLGNRSALDWIIDQYQVTTDKRSEITNDPNRLDDEQYIVRLIKQIITVSLETVEIVNNLPDLGLPKD